MKIIKRIILVLSICASCYTTVIAQNLDLLSATERDIVLIPIAKEVVMTYGPDYYREYSKPIVERYTIPAGEEAGKVIYHVIFLYDRTEESLEINFAARVNFWAETGRPTGVVFGNNFGIVIREGVDWRQNKNIVPYQESSVPMYNINNPDPLFVECTHL